MDNNEEKQDETFYDDYYGNNNDLDYKNDDESHNEEEKNVKEEKITNQSYYGRNIPQTKNKILLISFYIMMVIVLIIIYLLYRSNKYAFYLKKDEILLKNGSEYQVELLPKDLRYFDYLNYNYSIDNEKVATVDKYGTINTVGIGEAKLKISIKFGFGTKVMKIRSEDIKIDSIELKVDTDGKIEQKNKIGLYVDESITLRSFANKKDDFNINVSYTSSDVSIASVNEFGVVTAKKVGTAIISGTKDGVSGSIIVEVKKKETNTTPTKVKVDKVDIGITNTTMYVNDKLQLSAKVSPSNATGYTSKWTSNNNDIVEVSNNGLVTAKKRGTAVIKVVVDGKEASGTILVKEKQNTSPPTPQEIAVTGITINKTTTSIEVGKIDTLVATISPSNATNKLIAWSSSNSNVATVNNGVVTAKTVGTANITVTTANGKTATCVVTVKTPVPQEVAVTGVTLNKTNVSLEVGKTDTLVATISPSNATNKLIAWSSSNSNVATVNNGVVTAKTVGTANITVTTANGKTATCVVTVKTPVPQEVAVTGVTLNKTNVSLEVGKTDTLVATISPSNATNKIIAWSSSNTSIATVDANGKITGKAAGTVTITAKTNNGKTAACKVTITKQEVAVTGINLNKTTASIDVGSTITLTATISPSNATNKIIAWSSSNTSIATVDANGKITGKAAGTVTITAKTNNGKTAACKVTITKQEVAVTGINLNKTTASIDVGSTITLTATIAPTNATNKLIAWSSSNTSIATVDANGKVTGKNGGTVTITAKANNGKTATCKVTVKKENCVISLKEGNNESVANSNVENINNALQCAHRNNIKSLTVPKGNYYFNIAKKENNKYVLKPIYINFSNITLDLNGSTFNVYKNGSSSYVLFKIKNKDAGTATLKNGTLIGDRDVHICSDGSNMFCHDRMLRCYENEEYRSYESGHGVAISSTGVNVENLTIKNMMGDGIYVSFPYDISKNGMVNIQNNLIDSVRRNGISIIQGKNINIKSNVIRYTHGTWPQVGIDIERNNTTMFYENILIEGNTIYGNTGRRSVQLWAGIKGYMKIINNHLGDQVVGWDEAALQSAKGPKLERNLITIAGNDTKIPSGERDCVEDANTVTSHINRKCYDQIAEDDKCKK